MSTTAITTKAHKTFFGRLIAAIGGFLGKLINSAKAAFNSLPPDQQQALINGVNVSQIIKEGYAKGEAYIVSEITTATGLPATTVTPLILSALKDMNINVTSVQNGLNAIASEVQGGITDNRWNAIWRDFASFAASYLTGGSLNWVGLAMGLVEFAFQHFIAAKKPA